MIGVLAFAVAAAAAPEKPAVVSVHAQAAGGRAALEVVTTTAPVRVSLDRVDAQVVLTLDARLLRDLGPIAAVAPLRAVEVARTATGVVVRARVDRDVPYELRRQGTLLTVLFGTAVAEAPKPSADVQELYRGLLPPPTSEPSATDPAAAAAGADAGQAAIESEGLHLGLLTLRPQVAGVYVDSEGALLETAEPVPDRYYEIRPRLAADMPIGLGKLTADYEARVRQGSSYAPVENATTHLANAALELPTGPSLVWRAGGHFSRGLLETSEVDPGREYFFQLGAYTRYDASAGVRVETGSRLDLDLSGSYYNVDVDESSGFFDHEGWLGSAGLGFELGARLRGIVGYTYEEIPLEGTDRTQARMTAHSATVSLQGEILPLVNGFLTVGYRDQQNPAAGEGGQHYEGLTTTVRLLKEFTRSTTVELVARHGTQPSAFEDNGFYVASALGAEVNVALPFSVVALLGGGFHRNDYRVVSPEIGRPREDRIWGWLAGLGRPITDWAFVRADYRYEERDSNIDTFDTDAHSLTVQLGVRFYRQRARP